MGIEAMYKKSTCDYGVRIFGRFFSIDTYHSSPYLWLPVVSDSSGWGASHSMDGEYFRLSSGLGPLVVLLMVPFLF